MRRALYSVVAALVAASFTFAAPYEFDYVPLVDTGGGQGPVVEQFPEEQGWERFTRNGGVNRTIQNSALTLSSDDPETTDNYFAFMDEQLDAHTDEVFYAEWRMRVLPGAGTGDVRVYIGRDGAEGDAFFAYATDYFWSLHDYNNFAIDATVLHTYRIESYDMFFYDFYIDGQYTYTGVFDAPGIVSSAVGFGDFAIGDFSTSEWEYFVFGVAQSADFNVDGNVNLLDFAEFAQCFGGTVDSPPSGCSDLKARRSDMDGNGLINLADFAMFANQFGS